MAENKYKILSKYLDIKTLLTLGFCSEETSILHSQEVLQEVYLRYFDLRYTEKKQIDYATFIDHTRVLYGRGYMNPVGDHSAITINRQLLIYGKFEGTKFIPEFKYFCNKNFLDAYELTQIDFTGKYFPLDVFNAITMSTYQVYKPIQVRDPIFKVITVSGGIRVYSFDYDDFSFTTFNIPDDIPDQVYYGFNYKIDEDSCYAFDMWARNPRWDHKLYMEKNIYYLDQTGMIDFIEFDSTYVV